MRDKSNNRKSGNDDKERLKVQRDSTAALSPEHSRECATWLGTGFPEALFLRTERKHLEGYMVCFPFRFSDRLTAWAAAGKPRRHLEGFIMHWLPGSEVQLCYTVAEAGGTQPHTCVVKARV